MDGWMDANRNGRKFCHLACISFAHLLICSLLLALISFLAFIHPQLLNCIVSHYELYHILNYIAL